MAVDPDSMPVARRMAGVPVHVVVGHREARPPVESAGVAVDVPQNRADRADLPYEQRVGRSVGVAVAAVGVPQNRVPVAPEDVPASRPDHVRSWE